MRFSPGSVVAGRLLVGGGSVLQELVNLHNRSLPTQTFDWQEGKVMNDKMAHTSDKDLENYILNFVKRINYYDNLYDDWLLRWYLCEMLSHPSLQCRAVSADRSWALCFVKLWLRLSQFSADLSQMPARSDPSQSSVTGSQPASQVGFKWTNQPAGWGCYDDKYPAQADQTFNIPKCPGEGESLSLIVGIDFRLNVEIFMF